jgi:hypothetical protein
MGRQLKRPRPLMALAEKDEIKPIINQGSRNVQSIEMGGWCFDNRNAGSVWRRWRQWVRRAGRTNRAGCLNRNFRIQIGLCESRHHLTNKDI